MTPFRATCLVSLTWGNPYTEPPNGQPRQLWAATILDGGNAEEIRNAHSPAKVPGDGWAVCWSPIPKPVKRWSPERKANARRKRLRARLEKKTPLLADVLFDAELKRRPDYFDAEAIGRADAATNPPTAENGD